MEFLTNHKIRELAVKQKGMFAVYVSQGLNMFEPTDEKIWDFILQEICTLCGGNTTLKYYDYMSGLVNSGTFFFQTEGEAWDFYKIFEQPLTESSAIYANISSPDGVCMTENT